MFSRLHGMPLSVTRGVVHNKSQDVYFQSDVFRLQVSACLKDPYSVVLQRAVN